MVETLSKRKVYKTGKMVIAKEILDDYKEDYQKVLNHIDGRTKIILRNRPYHSLKETEDLLLRMQEKLENALASILAEETKDGKKDFTYKVLLANVQNHLGCHYDLTEQPTLSERYFRRCIALIEPHKTQPEAVIPYIRALYELSKVLKNAKKWSEALKWLKLSEKVYNDFKAIENAEAISITDLFGTSDELDKSKGSDDLMVLNLLCLFDLAQVNRKLQKLEEFVIDCHNSLRRQLDSNSYELANFNWKAAFVSRSFLCKNMFKESRHHLAAATLMIAEHEVKMITPEMSEGTIDDVKETFKRHYADLARGWAEYGLTLLNASLDPLLPDDDTKALYGIQSCTNVDSNEFRFPNLQLEVYENRVSTEFCLNLDDAKLIFQFVLNWLDQAKAYYKLDTKPTEYAEIIKDYADLYEHMAFFQENPLNKAKMRQLSAIYYEELIDAVNPTDYLDICRDCWYGAGIAYYGILEIFRNQDNPSPSLLEKINQVFKKSINNFLEFQKSCMENDCITLKPNLSTEEIHRVLYCNFYLGSIYYNMVIPDPILQLEYMNNSYKYNKRFTDGCDKYKEAVEFPKEKIRISKELVSRLPLEIENIKKLL